MPLHNQTFDQYDVNVWISKRRRLLVLTMPRARWAFEVGRYLRRDGNTNITFTGPDGAQHQAGFDLQDRLMQSERGCPPPTSRGTRADPDPRGA